MPNLTLVSSPSTPLLPLHPVSTHTLPLTSSSLNHTFHPIDLARPHHRLPQQPQEMLLRPVGNVEFQLYQREFWMLLVIWMIII